MILDCLEANIKASAKDVIAYLIDQVEIPTEHVALEFDGCEFTAFDGAGKKVATLAENSVATTVSRLRSRAGKNLNT